MLKRKLSERIAYPNENFIINQLIINNYSNNHN